MPILSCGCLRVSLISSPNVRPWTSGQASSGGKICSTILLNGPPLARRTHVQSLMSILVKVATMTNPRRRASQPSSFLPIPLVGRPYLTRPPFVLLLIATTALGWYQYHTALVLLLEYPDSSRSGSAVSDLRYSHARKACGIIQSNPSSPCLVNAIQPLWICGRNLRLPNEKFTVLQLLSRIQKQTGWKCGWRSQSLRDHWNLV